MIKGFILLPKRADLSDEEFHRHWRDVHAPLSLRLTNLRRYVQSHLLSAAQSPYPSVPWNGIAEVWFDDLATALDFPNDPDYLEGLYKDEPNFMDRSGMAVVFTQEHVVVAGEPMGQDLPVVKSMFFIERKAGMGVEEFQQYWREVHAPLVPDTPGLLRYVQCHVPLELYAQGQQPRFDGVAELWWPDLDTYARAMQSPAMTVDQANDLPNFNGAGTLAMMSEEVRVIWP